MRHPARARSLAGDATATSPSSSDDSRFTAPAAAGSGASTSSPVERYVFPRLNPIALGHGSPEAGATLPGVSAMTPPPACELTPELNEEIVAVLREQYMQQQQYDECETSDGRYDRLEGYADADIVDVVRAIVGHNGRRALPVGFPSPAWLAMFKRENDFVDVEDMVRARTRTGSGGNGNLKCGLPSQQQQQEHYNRSYELEQKQYELEHQRRGDQLRWIQNRSYRQPAAPPPSSPPQHSPIPRRAAYGWNDVEEVNNGELLPPPPSQQRIRFYQHPQRQARDEGKYRRSPSAGSSNGHSGHSDSTTGDRNYRQSNLVPAKVWERAMEDVAIHGMSLRNAAKAHGVHFAALHRRLKKRQQHKLNMPCEPNYIPFEDEAGVVRVIHARAEMGVLLTFTELVDLLKRTALKHRSELPEDIATALVRKFQSRVEQSVRHLIIDWPALPNNVLYQLRNTSSNGDNGKGGMATAGAVSSGKTNAPLIISGSSGDGGSLSSSGSTSSLSPHPQSVGPFPSTRKSPLGAAPASLWPSNRSGSSNVVGNNNSNEDNNDDVGNATAAPATVAPRNNDNNNKKTAPNQPCMILRL
ncbi:unnamed protein product [Phytophthora lilii]|uniref:Unnamed protein product n=1 Tax=Phytophthora lilii TaxID=2077276 RepID=A0A9W6WZ83_9STRA|nr:unnamed protein product [Phytophthora lilii]